MVGLGPYPAVSQQHKQTCQPAPQGTYRLSVLLPTPCSEVSSRLVSDPVLCLHVRRGIGREVG